MKKRIILFGSIGITVVVAIVICVVVGVGGNKQYVGSWDSTSCTTVQTSMMELLGQSSSPQVSITFNQDGSGKLVVEDGNGNDVREDITWTGNRKQVTFTFLGGSTYTLSHENNSLVGTLSGVPFNDIYSVVLEKTK